MRPELEQIAELVRAPHGQSSGDRCAVAQVPIALAGGSSSAEVPIPFDGTIAALGTPQNLVYVTIDADQGLDVHVRFGLTGLGAATLLDKTIAAGGSLQVCCMRRFETHFTVFATVAVDADPACTYYASGINPSAP